MYQYKHLAPVSMIVLRILIRGTLAWFSVFIAEDLGTKKGLHFMGGTLERKCPRIWGLSRLTNRLMGWYIWHHCHANTYGLRLR